MKPIILIVLSAVALTAGSAKGDIFRWDNGELIPGTEGITPGPGVQLDHRELEYADFRGSDLSNAEFSSSNLANATFFNATLMNADVSGAVVAGANFDFTTSHGFTMEQLYSTLSYKNKQLARTSFRSNNLEGWDFNGQDLTEADFFGVRLANSDLSEANFENSFFYSANLTNANLKSANLQSTYMVSARLEQADLSNANVTQANFSDAQLHNANFANATISGANFRNTTGFGLAKEQIYATKDYQAKNLRGLNLGFNDLSTWDFSGQDLTGANLACRQFTNSNFSDAIVNGAQLGWIGKEQLYSTASYQAKNLQGVGLSGEPNQWDFKGQDLSFAGLGAVAFGADFSGAIISGTYFAGSPGNGLYITKEQLYSTASYHAEDLRGVVLAYGNVSDWDFRGQYLANSDFTMAILGGADFTLADTRGSELSLVGAVTNNTIRPSGQVLGLLLEAGETLVVRDYDGDPEQSLGPIPVHIANVMTVAEDGGLRLEFESDAWDSIISFSPGIPVQLGGTLELGFTDDVDILSQVGRTFHVFDWTGVAPAGAFTVASQYPWDVSQLYTTGEVTLLLPGDTDGDQAVTLNDLNNVRNNFGGSGLGDTNGDGVIDLVDLNNVRNFFGVNASPAVPEPASAMIALVAGLAVLGLRRLT